MQTNDSGRTAKKIADQAKQIKALRGELSAAREALARWSALVDAVLAVTAVRCGMRTEKGWELTLPRFSEREIRDKYAVTAAVGADNDGFVLTVTEKTETQETNG